LPLVDLPSLMSELHLRGFNENKVDEALRCLVHVHAVQDSASPDRGGILAEDIINKYDLNIVQTATQLFLDRSTTQGKEVFRVRWGCDAAAESMEEQLWDNASSRWEEFVAQLDRRYLGFLMPPAEESGRIVDNWKLGKELRWFSVEIPSQGWKVLGIVDDVIEVAWKLDLAFGYRSFGTDGVQAPKVLLHKTAYEVLRSKREPPPGYLLKAIRLWRFFSEYDVNSTDFVALMRECNLTLEEVVEQVSVFFSSNLTSQYRDGQYPPYFINDKKKKEFDQAVRELLQPMNAWLQREQIALAAPLPQRGPGEKATRIGKTTQPKKSS